MKNALISLVAALLSLSLVAPTFAQRQAPKSTELPPKVAEEPEMQQQKSKTKASQSGRKSKKPDASIDERKGKNTERPPTGIEGPETRKSKKKDASSKPNTSTGPAGSDMTKEQKKP